MECADREIRCGKCGRLLGTGTALRFMVKCRCGTYNHIQVVTMRVKSPISEKSESNHATEQSSPAAG
ncbi:Com family DNA-binding transcriptional regulator [Bilophila wadsworthia]|uniref:Com family DNA-binding transcriptional regulator n=1 Tax=Bilophila wadsworthia TaxID=35833 RepID=UPI0009DD9A7B|nr:Com family DNA-binding transcriptional regulator [Bilophila wadsworthia]